MHDPMFLLYHVKPLGLDIWHTEPGDRDAGEVCSWPNARGPRRLGWAIKHWRHTRWRWWPYLNIKRWLVDRCAECGHRFAWKQARCSYQSTDQVWHDKCMSLRHVRGQLDDLTGYIMDTADDNARWRAAYRLKNLEKASDQPNI